MIYDNFSDNYNIDLTKLNNINTVVFRKIAIKNNKKRNQLQPPLPL